MAVPIFVITHHPLLDTLLRNRHRDMYFPVFAAICSHNPQLDRIQRMSGVPAGKLRQKFQRVFLYLCLVSAHALFPVADRLSQKLLDILFFQRL